MHDTPYSFFSEFWAGCRSIDARTLCPLLFMYSLFDFDFTAVFGGGTTSLCFACSFTRNVLQSAVRIHSCSDLLAENPILFVFHFFFICVFCWRAIVASVGSARRSNNYDSILSLFSGHKTIYAFHCFSRVPKIKMKRCGPLFIT